MTLTSGRTTNDSTCKTTEHTRKATPRTASHKENKVLINDYPGSEDRAQRHKLNRI